MHFPALQSNDPHQADTPTHRHVPAHTLDKTYPVGHTVLSLEHYVRHIERADSLGFRAIRAAPSEVAALAPRKGGIILVVELYGESP